MLKTNYSRHVRISRLITRCQNPRSAQNERFSPPSWGKVAIAIAAAACVAGQNVSAEEMTLGFKASPDPAIRAAQTQLVEVFAYVNYYYIDMTYGGVDWQIAFRDALQASYSAKSAEEVRSLTNALLNRLGDPYSRILPASAARKFQAESAGQVVAYGIGTEYADADNTCKVALVAPGSSAAAAGVAVGDTIAAVNGKPMDAAVYQELKQALQAREADTLALELAKKDGTTASVQLALTEVDVNPCQYSVLDVGRGKRVGYIRIVVFADTVPASVSAALDSLLRRGISGLVIDLRDNPGGLLSSGVDVARQFLQDEDDFLFVAGRDRFQEAVPISGSVVKPQVARLPMAVLVNHGTASTSEILSSAFRADKGAILVGETTFGKGRSQRIIPLSDKSLLLLSSVSYLTADRQVIEKKGLTPDIACAPEAVDSFYQGGEMASSSLGDDPCIKLAAKALLKR